MLKTEEKVRVRVLAEADITERIVDQVNVLVRKQHDKAYQNDPSGFRDFVRRSMLVVALGNDKVIGLISYVDYRCLTHTRGSIHNFIIGEGQDCMVLGRMLIKKLMENILALPDIISFDAPLPDPRMEKIFIRLRFKRRNIPGFWFRPASKRR